MTPAWGGGGGVHLWYYVSVCHLFFVGCSFSEAGDLLFFIKKEEARLQTMREYSGEERKDGWIVKRSLMETRAAWVGSHFIPAPTHCHPPPFEHKINPGRVRNFQEWLSNIFSPLWEASAFPHRDPNMDHLLRHTSGLDFDADSHHLPAATTSSSALAAAPALWDLPADPPYQYYCFYLWANLAALNRFRARQRQPQLLFRPHATLYAGRVCPAPLLPHVTRS